MISSLPADRLAKQTAERKVKTVIQELSQTLISVGNGNWVPEIIQEVSRINEMEMKATGLQIRHKWAVAKPTNWFYKIAQRIFLAIEPVIIVPPLFENVRAERLHFDVQVGGRRYSDIPNFWVSPFRWKISKIANKLINELSKALFPEETSSADAKVNTPAELI